MIEAHPGDIQNHAWDGRPIEVLFIDCAKNWPLHLHIKAEFFGSLLPGRSIVVQQDYHHSQTPWLILEMQHLAPYFRIIHTPFGGTVGFVLTKEIPRELLRADLRELPLSEALRLMDDAASLFRGFWRLFVTLAKAQLLIERGRHDEAADVLRQARRSRAWHPILGWDAAQIERQLPPELLSPPTRLARVVSYYRGGGASGLIHAAANALHRRLHT